MNVNPRLAHTLETATDVSAVPGSLSRPGLLTTGNVVADPVEVGQHAERRLEEEQPGEARDRHRRGHGGGEDRPEDPQAAEVPVGEHRHRHTEHHAGRHREQGELDRHPQRVLELLAAEDVDVLFPTPLLAERSPPAPSGRR